MATARITSTLAGLVAALALVSPAQAGARDSGYGWPVKPFHVQHPVRGYFGDPRIGMTPSGMRSTFHFGIDISVPDGTPVYATLTGTVLLWSHRPDAVAVVGANGTMFSYWHIRRSVSAGQHVIAYRTVLGYVEKGWGHVHFSEHRGDGYVNPLRPGAMRPYADPTRPTVKSLRAERGDAGVKQHRLSGVVDLVVEAFDETPLAVPAPWADRPVTPALVRWRVRGRGWRVAVDYRTTIPDDRLYDRVYALWTRQNKPWSNGRYRLYLAHDWDTRSLPDGRYHIEVEASDTRWNRSIRSFPIRVRNRFSPR